MNKDDQGLSEGLKGFIPRPAPPDLRNKVLEAARGICPAARFLTPRQWGLAAVCALLVCAALAGDSLISKRQARQLDALLNDRPTASPTRDSERSALEELVGVDAARAMRLRAARPAPNRAVSTDRGDDRISLSFQEREDADVHSKNPR